MTPLVKFVSGLGKSAFAPSILYSVVNDSRNITPLMDNFPLERSPSKKNHPNCANESQEYAGKPNAHAGIAVYSIAENAR